MIILLNTTKTMDLAKGPGDGIAAGEPRFQAEAAELAAALRRLGSADLAALMDLGPELADRVRADLSLWGAASRPRRPALFAFTGLVYRRLEPHSLPVRALRDAGRRLRILSGLYGYLRPFDRIEAYRLEMGCRLAAPGGGNLTGFWRERVTGALDEEVAGGRPVLDLTSREYGKVIDRRRLRGPIITPVFKDRRPDGSLKVVTVHAKQARGLMARFCLEHGCREPRDLLAFGADGWEAAGDPPESGDWLFRR